jgi:hypothetical protein
MFIELNHPKMVRDYTLYVCGVLSYEVLPSVTHRRIDGLMTWLDVHFCSSVIHVTQEALSQILAYP